MEAFVSANVSQGEQAPHTFQIEFSDDYSLSAYQDIPVVQAEALGIGERLTIKAGVGADQRTLIDGVITQVSYIPPTDGAAGRYTVSGEDISYFMTVVDYARTYPFSLDALIVTAILAPYCATFSLLPDIHETVAGLLDIFTTPVQSGNDRDIVMQLASAHNFIFTIRQDGLAGAPSAYWGPRPYGDPPQKPIVLGYAGGGNTASLQFSFDGTSSQRTWSLLENKETEIMVPFAAVTSLSGIDFAARPALTSSAVKTAKNLLCRQGANNIPLAMAKAQSQTDASTDAVVTGHGKVDALAYGGVMTAPGVISVAGAGTSYDGRYYLSEVTHTLSRERYEQSFQISREGIGSTLGAV